MADEEHLVTDDMPNAEHIEPAHGARKRNDGNHGLNCGALNKEHKKIAVD
jgi:hypothetical protein